MFKALIIFLLTALLAAFALLAINPDTYFYFQLFTVAAVIFSIALLIYGIRSLKEKKYLALFGATTKLGEQSTRPAISVIVISIALLGFSYNFHFKGVLHFKMKELIHEVEAPQAKDHSK